MPGFLARYFVPVALGLSAVLLAAGGETVRLALRYERSLIEAGELWRLATGHLVHLGSGHLLLDLAALAVLALLFAPWLGTCAWLLVTVVSALAIDAGLYFLSPALEWYVGLSGLLHGYWAAGCMLALSRRHWPASTLLVLLVGKLVYEGYAGPLGASESLVGGPVVTAAHVWGALGGAASWPLILAIRCRRRWL